MLLVAQKRFPILSRTGKEAAVSHFSLFQVNDSVFFLAVFAEHRFLRVLAESFDSRVWVL